MNFFVYTLYARSFTSPQARSVLYQGKCGDTGCIRPRNGITTPKMQVYNPTSKPHSSRFTALYKGGDFITGSHEEEYQEGKVLFRK
jgi:hypothetical protein